MASTDFSSYLSKLEMSARRASRLLDVKYERILKWIDGDEPPYGPAKQLLKLIIKLDMSVDEALALLSEDAERFSFPATAETINDRNDSVISSPKGERDSEEFDAEPDVLKSGLLNDLSFDDEDEAGEYFNPDRSPN